MGSGGVDSRPVPPETHDRASAANAATITTSAVAELQRRVGSIWRLAQELKNCALGRRATEKSPSAISRLWPSPSGHDGGLFQCHCRVRQAEYRWHTPGNSLPPAWRHSSYWACCRRHPQPPQMDKDLSKQGKVPAVISRLRGTIRSRRQNGAGAAAADAHASQTPTSNLPCSSHFKDGPVISPMDYSISC